MSEKYSTDELEKSIEETYLERMDLFERFIGSYPQRNAQYDRRDAIIARLRAADKLVKALERDHIDEVISRGEDNRKFYLEKYGPELPDTEELVNALMGTTICNDIIDATVARLRAADRANERLAEIEQLNLQAVSEMVYPTVKKYLTDELIDALNRKTRGYGFADIQENEIDAIISKLRAADKLCEAAKSVSATVREEKEIWESELKRLDKAIADYGGKEGEK